MRPAGDLVGHPLSSGALCSSSCTRFRPLLVCFFLDRAGRQAPPLFSALIRIKNFIGRLVRPGPRLSGMFFDLPADPSISDEGRCYARGHCLSVFSSNFTFSVVTRLIAGFRILGYQKRKRPAALSQEQSRFSRQKNGFQRKDPRQKNSPLGRGWHLGRCLTRLWADACRETPNLPFFSRKPSGILLGRSFSFW